MKVLITLYLLLFAAKALATDCSADEIIQNINNGTTDISCTYDSDSSINTGSSGFINIGDIYVYNNNFTNINSSKTIDFKIIDTEWQNSKLLFTSYLVCSTGTGNMYESQKYSSLMFYDSGAWFTDRVESISSTSEASYSSVFTAFTEGGSNLVYQQGSGNYNSKITFTINKVSTSNLDCAIKINIIPSNGSNYTIIPEEL